MAPSDKDNRPTIYDVARLSGLSITTVSRVINSTKKVKEDTRAKVLAAIETLGFVPEGEAVARTRKDVGRIGVLTPFFTAPSFVQRMRGIAAGLVDTRFELIIYPVESVERLENYLVTLPTTRRLDGLIVMSLPVNDGAVQRLRSSQIETVLIEYPHPVFNVILIDDRLGGRLAAQHLIEKGHRQMAFIHYGQLPGYSIHPELQRFAGFQEELAAAGLGLSNEYILWPSINQPDIRQELQQLMNLPKPPTAIFTPNDELAFRVIHTAREMGLRVPGDLAVIGFDDIDMAKHFGLTTISQSLEQSGRLAAEIILARLADDTRPLQHINLQLKLIERETT